MMKKSNCRKKGLVSIIVPVYNVEKYVDRCLQTLIRQTYRNIEIIIVDDGSPDQSGPICDAIALRDSRIRVIHQKNQGLSGARNTGIEVANGQYLLFVDSDDWIREEMVESLYTLLQQYDAQIVACGTEICCDKGHVAYHSDDLEETRVYTREEAMRELLEDCRIRNVVWNKLYRSDLFDDVRFPIGMIFEDIATTYKLIDKAETIVYCGKPMYCYYKSEDSIIRSTFSEKKFDKVKACRERAQFYSEYYPEMENKASLIYIKTSLNYLVASYRANANIQACRRDTRNELLEWIDNHHIIIPLKDKVAVAFLRLGLVWYDIIICSVCVVISKVSNNGNHKNRMSR